MRDGDLRFPCLLRTVQQRLRQTAVNARKEHFLHAVHDVGEPLAQLLKDEAADMDIVLLERRKANRGDNQQLAVGVFSQAVSSITG